MQKFKNLSRVVEGLALWSPATKSFY